MKLTQFMPMLLTASLSIHLLNQNSLYSLHCTDQASDEIFYFVLSNI